MKRQTALLRDIGALLAVVGLLTGRPSVVAAATFVVAVWLLSNRAGRRALQRMVTTQTLSPAAVRVNQVADLAVSVTNASAWPIPLLEWSGQLAQGIEVMAREGSLITISGGRKPAVHGRYSMRRWEEVIQHVLVRSNRRGRYVFGPTYLEIRDPLGFADVDKSEASEAILTVFPALCEVPSALTMPTAPYGTRRGLPWSPPDPTRYVGIRPYEPGDSPRLIHPFASARTGTLQVKRLETEADDEVELVALASTAPYLWEGVDPLKLESLIVAAASTAYHYIHQGAAVGFSLAGSVYGQPHGFAVKPENIKDQWARIQTALAWVTPGGGTAGDLTAILGRLASRSRPGTRICVFTCFFARDWIPYVERLRRRGLRVTWVAVGGDTEFPALPGVSIVHWTPESLKLQTSEANTPV